MAINTIEDLAQNPRLTSLPKLGREAGILFVKLTQRSCKDYR